MLQPGQLQSSANKSVQQEVPTEVELCALLIHRTGDISVPVLLTADILKVRGHKENSVLFCIIVVRMLQLKKTYWNHDKGSRLCRFFDTISTKLT